MDYDYHENGLLFPSNNNPNNSNSHLKYNTVIKKPTIDFCCTIDVPSGFSMIDNPECRFLYSTDCLSTYVTSEKVCYATDCGPIYAMCFKAKIVGSIPYLISVGVSSPCGGVINGSVCETEMTDNPVGYLCCKGNILVDVEIGNSTHQLQMPSLDCNSVKLVNFGTTQGQSVTFCDKKLICPAITIVGTIELPIAVVSYGNCPLPTF